MQCADNTNQAHPASSHIISFTCPQRHMFGIDHSFPDGELRDKLHGSQGASDHLHSSTIEDFLLHA